jgi:uncharacterized coiled-coil protein SlyX
VADSPLGALQRLLTNVPEDIASAIGLVRLLPDIVEQLEIIGKEAANLAAILARVAHLDDEMTVMSNNVAGLRTEVEQLREEMKLLTPALSDLSLVAHPIRRARARRAGARVDVEQVGSDDGADAPA